MATHLKITQVKSTIDRLKVQKLTMRALGIRKMHQTVIHPDNPAMRGMIAVVHHLVTVEEING